MFKVSNFFDVKYINLELKSETKEEILKEMTDLISDKLTDKDKFYEDLLNRESSGSTALEFGFAIPHARSKYVKDFTIAIGVKREGIVFDSLDNKKTKLFFLIATNDKYNDYHLDSIVSFAKLISNENIVNVLTATNSKEGFIDIFRKIEN